MPLGHCGFEPVPLDQDVLYFKSKKACWSLIQRQIKGEFLFSRLNPRQLRTILISVILFLISAYVSFSQYSKVSFYFSAHPDDWQLFMGANAFKDIAEATARGSNKKVVFIYTTGGEANCNNGIPDEKFYLARQAAANRCVQFCADINSLHDEWHSSTKKITGTTLHDILRMSYKNVVCYYLRLPDGCFEKSSATIKKLNEKIVDSICAIDNSTIYYGYQDLLLSVQNIVKKECSGAEHRPITFNASDWDGKINGGDHPDHVETGLLATKVAQRMAAARVVLFSGYGTGDKPVNMKPDEIAMKAAVVSQLNPGMTHNGYTFNWDEGHRNWAMRNYFRVYRRKK